MKHCTVLVISLMCLMSSCKLFTSEDTDNITDITDSTRFKELETPIEGTLLFMAGPSHYETDSTAYMNDLFDFYQLSGTSFEKLNNTPLIYGPGQMWNFQWSHYGNYLSFFHDKFYEPNNTDDIAVLDLNSMELNYLTETLGAANT